MQSFAFELQLPDNYYTWQLHYHIPQRCAGAAISQPPACCCEITDLRQDSGLSGQPRTDHLSQVQAQVLLDTALLAVAV